VSARVVVRVEAHPMAGEYAPYPGTDRTRYIAVCATEGCRWRSRYQVVKVAAQDEAKYHREHHRRAQESA